MVDFTALPGTLDLFELMVNYVAGDILLSIVIWGVILLIIGIMGRLSMQSILIILLTFLGVVIAGYFGAWAFMGILGIALWYMISGILNWVNQVR